MSDHAPDAAANASPAPSGRRSAWTFLSNHARVLTCLADDPSIRLRDVARQVGITERAAQSIVADLAAAGYVTRTRVGRRNQYEVHRNAPMREGRAGLTVGELLDLLSTVAEPVTTRAYGVADDLERNGTVSRVN